LTKDCRDSVRWRSWRWSALLFYRDCDKIERLKSNINFMLHDKKIIIIGSILLVLAVGGYFYIRGAHPEILNKLTASQAETVRAKAEKFINENLVNPGTQAQIKEITREGGLYKVLVDVEGQELTAYISRDGKNFFPQAFNMDDWLLDESFSEQEAQMTPGSTSVPSVELFVMSYCPYGLQMEKGILPVIKLLGSKIDFELKFVNYVMHGEEEIEENLRQYCIGQQGIDKLENYLECFLLEGNSKFCLGQVKINNASLNACVDLTDSQYEITESFKNQQLWLGGQFPPFNIHAADNIRYGISGSPSLVVNGVLVSVSRDPQSLLDLICSAFLEQPDECGQQLSNQTPSPSFGEGTTAGSDSSCGN